MKLSTFAFIFFCKLSRELRRRRAFERCEGGRQTSWRFASMAEGLNSGIPRTTPAAAQSGT